MQNENNRVKPTTPLTLHQCDFFFFLNHYIFTRNCDQLTSLKDVLNNCEWGFFKTGQIRSEGSFLLLLANSVTSRLQKNSITLKYCKIIKYQYYECQI